MKKKTVHLERKPFHDALKALVPELPDEPSFVEIHVRVSAVDVTFDAPAEKPKAAAAKPAKPPAPPAPQPAAAPAKQPAAAPAKQPAPPQAGTKPGTTAN